MNPGDVLAEARLIANEATTWADLSNSFFDPADGLVARWFPEAAERADFRKTDAFGELHKLVGRKMSETGVVAGAVPAWNCIEEA